MIFNGNKSPLGNCIICGFPVTEHQERVGGRVKRGGLRWAHKKCWDREQAELAKEVQPCPTRLKKK